MGRKSYLGGSTIIKKGDGTRPKSRRSRPKAAVESSLAAWECHLADIAKCVTDYVYEGAPYPDIHPHSLLDCAKPHAELTCVSRERLKAALARQPASSPDYFDFIEHIGELVTVSVWMFQDDEGRNACAAYLRDRKNPRVLGFFNTPETLRQHIEDQRVAVGDSLEELARMPSAGLTKFRVLAANRGDDPSPIQFSDDKRQPQREDPRR